MRSVIFNTLKLFIVLQFSITVSAVNMGFIAAHTYQFAGNLIILVIILSGFLIYGRVSLSVFSLSITALAIIGYLISPGDFTVGVPLLPFIGFFLIPKHYNIYELREKYGKLAKRVSLINVALIYIICYVGTLCFDLRLVNNISQLFLYLILINLIFFREPFLMTVLFGTILSTLFTPGEGSLGSVPILGITHQGNRSAIFLILFLFNKEYIIKFFSLLKKKKYFIKIFVLTCVAVFAASVFVDWFLNRPKNIYLYKDPRFLWLYPMLKLLLNDGIIRFFEQGSDLLYFIGEGRTNPHNSFIYLLLAEYWVGLLKNVVYILSMLIIPLSAWMAICGRAFFDIFFFLGPHGIIFTSLVSVFFRERLRKILLHAMVIKKASKFRTL